MVPLVTLCALPKVSEEFGVAWQPANLYKLIFPSQNEMKENQAKSVKDNPYCFRSKSMCGSCPALRRMSMQQLVLKKMHNLLPKKSCYLPFQVVEEHTFDILLYVIVT